MVTMLMFNDFKGDMVKSGTQAECFRGICYLYQQARLIIMEEEDVPCEMLLHMWLRSVTSQKPP
jgi:hypothetical protein